MITDDRIFPTLLDETIIKKDGDKYLFLIPSKPDWIVTNNNGYVALSLCNGTRSLDDIKKLLCDYPLRDQCANFIRDLYNNNFFHKTECSVKSKTVNLKSVHLNISSKCNLKCAYCYAEERNNNKNDNLTLNEYYKLLNELKQINDNIEISITGGEPLLNKDAVYIASRCKNLGFYVHLLTNGTLINKNNYKDIAKNTDVIRISIDGPFDTVNDIHRGKGTFDKIINTISLLQSIDANIKLAMTVTKNNINYVEKMAEMFGSILIYQPLFNAGNAKDKEISITGIEYYNALKKANRVDPFADIGSYLKSLRHSKIKKCAIGDVEISISSTGDVFPCHMLHLDEFFCGNIRNEKIEEIYKNSTVLDSCRKLDVSTRDNCSTCPVRYLCCGSCRARAYYINGNIDSVDDFCEYEFLSFINGLLDSANFETKEKDTICEHQTTNKC